MKFFKRELIGVRSKENDTKWAQALDEYRQYISNVFDRLPASVQEYETGGFHDSEVMGILRDEENDSVYVLLGCGEKLHFVGIVSYKYTGDDITPDHPNTWLYDELEILGNSLIEFRILLQDGELNLTARTVYVQELQSR